jgi:hypothetical protein
MGFVMIVTTTVAVAGMLVIVVEIRMGSISAQTASV